MKNLVISNNDNLWSEEFINILVGDWCFLGYEDKCSHNKFKYEIFDSHWSNLNKLNDDIKYLQSKVWDEVIDFIWLPLIHICISSPPSLDLVPLCIMFTEELFAPVNLINKLCVPDRTVLLAIAAMPEEGVGVGCVNTGLAGQEKLTL